MAIRKLIKNNTKSVLKILFNRLKLKNSNILYKEILRHPENSSLLAFHHIFKKFGLNNIAIQTTIEQLTSDIPKPVLIHISSNGGMFLVLERIDSEYAYIINEKNKLEKQSIDDFRKSWNGYALVFDKDNIRINSISKTEKITNYLEEIEFPIIASSLSIFIILIIFKNYENIPIHNMIYPILYSIGVCFSSLLLLEKIDKNNPLIKSICSSKQSSKINCSSILNSKAAYVFSNISWADLGFLYFIIHFILSVFYPSEAIFTVLRYSSLIAFPYVGYSIIYQKFIAKDWCLLCLSVMSVLSCLMIASLYFTIIDFHSLIINLDIIQSIILVCLFIIPAYIIMIRLISSYKKNKNTERQLNSIKYNELIKEVLFENSSYVNSNNLKKIILGSVNSEQIITLVFSPICEPCIQELKKLLPIIKQQSNIRLELIFLLDSERHPDSLTISKNLIHQYQESNKDFINYLLNYTNNFNIEKRKLSKDYYTDIKIEEMLKEHDDWCTTNKISSTPKIYINNKRIPSIYNVEDIEYIY